VQGGEHKLTDREAYLAMLEFLQDYWERGGCRADDLAVLLGSAAINNADGISMDPALWSEWLEAVAKVRARDTKA
jgi:hypothetical protein